MSRGLRPLVVSIFASPRWRLGLELTGAVLVALGKAAVDDPPLFILEPLGPARIAAVHSNGRGGETLPSGEGWGARFMNGRAASAESGCAGTCFRLLGAQTGPRELRDPVVSWRSLSCTGPAADAFDGRPSPGRERPLEVQGGVVELDEAYGVCPAACPL